MIDQQHAGSTTIEAALAHAAAERPRPESTWLTE